MFEQIPNSFLDLQKLKLVHLYTSLNQPNISPGSGFMAQPALGYIVVVQSKPTLNEIFVGLFFPESDQRVLYKGVKVSGKDLANALQDAESFLGEMGFLMDNAQYETAAHEWRLELQRTVPFFYSDIKLFYQALSETELKAKKSKAETTSIQKNEVDMQKLFLEQYVSIVGML